MDVLWSSQGVILSVSIGVNRVRFSVVYHSTRFFINLCLFSHLLP